MERDQNIDWMRKRISLLGAIRDNLTVAAVNEAGSAAFTIGELLQNADEATPATPDIFLRNAVDISQAWLTGIGFNAAGDIATCKIICPYDLDPSYPIGFRVAFINDSLTAGSLLFKIWLSALWDTVNGLIKPDTSATALDTVLATTTVTSIFMGFTSRGIKKNLFNATRAVIESETVPPILAIGIELDTVTTIAAADVILTDLIMDYVPQKTVGNGSLFDRPLKSTGVS